MMKPEIVYRFRKFVPTTWIPRDGEYLGEILFSKALIRLDMG